MPTLNASRIRHSVVFNLKDSAAEADFFAAIAKLAEVPGVEEFELLEEVSPKNQYRHGLSMEFADRGAYEAYNEHPAHVAFVRDRWDAEVADFMEIDYQARLNAG